MECRMKKILSIIAVLLFNTTSAFALPMSGTVSADYDLSFESIIKRKFSEIMEISKVFEKNDDFFYQRRFKPVYMLSLHELYSKKPLLKSNVEKRKIPNTYNLSLNNDATGVQNEISFSSDNLKSNVKEVAVTEKKDEYVSSKAEYETLISQNPDRIELLYKYAQFLYFNKKYAESIIVLNNIIQKDDSFVLASYTLGNIYFDMGNYKDAIKANINVIKKNPYCADAYFNIASALEKMHKFNLAIDYYNKCLSLNENDEQAQKALQRLEQLTYISY